MKKTRLAGLVLAFFAAMIIVPNIFADEYDTIAAELSDSAKELKSPKIALVPFSYSGTGVKDDGGGNVVSDRLTTKIVKLKKFQVIDRESLQKVLEEQKLQTSGVVDPETAKKIGKVLGVEAIITGSLTNMSGGMVEVNAKLIRTETAEIINVSSAKVEKDWVTSQETQQENQAYEQPVQKAAARPRVKADVYCDIFYGFSGSGSADITFENGRGLGSWFSNDTKLEFPSATEDITQNPLGIRFAFFGEKGFVGGAFDMMYYATKIANQSTSYSFPHYTGQWTPPAGFLKESTFLMDFDLMFRYPGKVVQPYVGVGVGISFNSINSSIIPGYTSGSYGTGFDEFAVGFGLNIPIGIRVSFNNDIGMFIETRSITNYVSFTRGGVSGDADTYNMTNNFTQLGVSFKFPNPGGSGLK